MVFRFLFEQSGTFKKEAKKLGYQAEDYDILNDFGETDHQIDLYAEIEKAYDGKESIFDGFAKDDIVMAFFPCTRFEAQIAMFFRGDANGYSQWELKDKLRYGMMLHEELHHNYMLISKLVILSLERGFPLVIENPYNSQHYLTRYWAAKPKVIDHDRTRMGDYYVKPTQYWFFNKMPENNVLLDEAIAVYPRKTIEGSARGAERSLISPEYARAFIRTYLLKDERRNEE